MILDKSRSPFHGPAPWNEVNKGERVRLVFFATLRLKRLTILVSWSRRRFIEGRQVGGRGESGWDVM